MDEFGKAQVGDARLTKRLIKLADRLGSAPSASILGACSCFCGPTRASSGCAGPEIGCTATRIDDQQIETNAVESVCVAYLRQVVTNERLIVTFIIIILNDFTLAWSSLLFVANRI